MRKILVALVALLTLLGLSACAANPTTPASAGSASASMDAKRSVTHEKGTTEIPAHPQRIVSTSVVLTGTLLALDAPVVGSGGSKPNAVGLDSHGWWQHWSKIAEERHVQSLFTSGNLDLEAITAAKPDVILVAATGGDSFVDKYDQLKSIAPTLVIDYNSHSWEDVTKTLGDDLGLQDKAASVLQEFDTYAAASKEKIKDHVPSAPVNIGVYSGNGGISVGLPTAPQATILKQLGITVADTGITPEKGRTDFGFTTPEQANQALKASELLLVGNDDKDVAALMADARFANLPAVKAKKVHPLGLASFKLDYYAAKDMVAHVVDVYGK